MQAKTPRGKILETALKLTEGDRNKTYGAPEVGLQCQFELWQVYEKFCIYAETPHTPAHQAAMQMLFAKLSRIACGIPGHDDNYVDADAYLAIASEVDKVGPIE